MEVMVASLMTIVEDATIDGLAVDFMTAVKGGGVTDLLSVEVAQWLLQTAWLRTNVSTLLGCLSCQNSARISLFSAYSGQSHWNIGPVGDQNPESERHRIKHRRKSYAMST